jgi:hypothetical protein
LVIFQLFCRQTYLPFISSTIHKIEISYLTGSRFCRSVDVTYLKKRKNEHELNTVQLNISYHTCSPHYFKMNHETRGHKTQSPVILKVALTQTTSNSYLTENNSVSAMRTSVLILLITCLHSNVRIT